MELHLKSRTLSITGENECRYVTHLKNLVNTDTRRNVTPWRGIILWKLSPECPRTVTCVENTKNHYRVNDCLSSTMSVHVPPSNPHKRTIDIFFSIHAKILRKVQGRYHDSQIHVIGAVGVPLGSSNHSGQGTISTSIFRVVTTH